MEADDITKTIVEYVKNHRNQDIALIPENIPQGILDILLEDSKDLAVQAKMTQPTAGRYLTTSVLLLLSIRNKSTKVDVSQQELSKSISRFTQVIYLESLLRQGLIRNLQPEFDINNLLDTQIVPTYEITDLGKQALQDALDPLPNYKDNELTIH